MMNNTNTQTKKLNICIMNDSFFPSIDGVIMVVDNYARRLSKIANVTVVVPEYRKTDFDYSRLPYKVVFCKSMYIYYNRYYLALPQFSPKFKKFMDSQNFDIIHCHAPFFGKWMQAYAKKKNIPFVITFHTKFWDDFKTCFKLSFIADLCTKRTMKVFNKAYEVWAVNDATKQTALDYGYNGKSLIVMKNATDMVFPENYEEKREKVNKEYALNKDETVFSFVARISTTKNIWFLLNSLKIMKDKGLKYKMFIVGDGPAFNELQSRTEKMGLSENVILTGSIMDRDKLSDILARSDLFLFPSIYDNCPIVILEAASHKVPAVFIKGTSSATAVIDNQNGFVSENSEEAFANRTIEILQDKARLKEVSENAYKEVYKHWDNATTEAYNRYLYIIEKYKAENNKQ